MATTTDARDDPVVVSGLRGIVLLAGAALIGLTAGSAPAAPHPSRGGLSTARTGTLALSAELRMRSEAGPCPAGTPTGSVECFGRQGRGVVRGLGNVSESYSYPVDTSPANCPADVGRVLGYTARFTVAGKGEIDFAVAGLADCLETGAIINPTQPFTVIGGSGAYAGATGSGTLTHAASYTAFGAVGTDTWIGTLVVPGREFDLAAPTLSGAVGKTVRAPRGVKRVRLTYKVTARDAVDGVVPVICLPRSGSLFRIGRTTVSCSATDESGNTARARFTVTVRARR